MKNSKKLVNLISLVVLVATNILSPLSYVTAEEDLDIGDTASYGDEGGSGGDSYDDESTVDSEISMDSDVADAYSDSDEGDVETTPQPSAAPLTGSETLQDDLPLCEERGTACGGEVDSEPSMDSSADKLSSGGQDEIDNGTGENSAIDTLKEIIDNLSGDVEVLSGDVLTGDIQELTGDVEELTGTALELAMARETLNSDPIEKSEKYNKVTVNVLAPVNTFPEGTKLVIDAIKGAALEEVRQQISDEPTNNVDEDAEIVAFDIRFEYELSDGSRVELQPKENTVQVTFDYSKNKELKKAETDDSQQIEIYHINDKDNNGEKVESGAEVVEKIEINEEKSEEVDNALVIDAEKFSIYVVTVNGQDYNVIYSDRTRKTTIEGSDNSMNDFEYSTITIPVGGGDDIIMMDRNLGARIRWNTDIYAYNQDYSTIHGTENDFYGYYYKWGNNYGFSSGDSAFNSASYGSQDDWGQGPCPAGWHVPTNDEWANVVEVLNPGYDSVGFLKSLLLPAAGFRDSQYTGGPLQYVGEQGGCWSSTPDDTNTSAANYIVANVGSYKNIMTTWSRKYFGKTVDPKMKEKRGYVMLMLMRSSK